MEHGFIFVLKKIKVKFEINLILKSCNAEGNI
jgi:hypothetical protein